MKRGSLIVMVMICVRASVQDGDVSAIPEHFCFGLRNRLIKRSLSSGDAVSLLAFLSGVTDAAGLLDCDDWLIGVEVLCVGVCAGVCVEGCGVGVGEVGASFSSVFLIYHNMH